MRTALPLLLLVSTIVACSKRTTGPLGGSEAPAPSSSVVVLHGIPCGALECAQYASAPEAFADVLALDPLALGVGEAHAPKGAVAPSSAKHFTDELLPSLAGRASDLLVELMMPPSGCAAAAAEAKKAQQPITGRQAETDQNEYVVMGEHARGLGIVPDMLRPSCADMDRVRDAGADVVGTSLALIARLTRTQATKLLERDARSDADHGKAVVIYGGLLHNDLSPPAAREAWSYAVDLERVLPGRFVALDLIVPEFITDDETWRSLPWYGAYDRARLGSKATLFRTGERSFVLVLPETH